MNELPDSDNAATAKVVKPESIPIPEGKLERRELRTANSKTFIEPQLINGREVRTCEIRLAPVCYQDDTGELRSIDTTIRTLDDGKIGIDWAPYKFRLHETGIGFDFTSRSGGWCSIMLAGIGGDRFDSDKSIKPDIADNSITFRDVRHGCDIVFKCLNDRVKTLRILKDEKAPKSFEWLCECDGDGSKRIANTLIGTDAAGNQLNLKTEMDSIDEKTVRFVEAWDGTTSAMNGKSTDPKYPVQIDPTVTVNPAASSDDGYAISGAWTSNASIYTGCFGFASFDIGIRFPGVTIPQGSTINSATLTLYSLSASGNAGDGTIYGWANDNPPVFDASHLPGSVSHTSASVALPANGAGGNQSWTVTTIIQEIVNRSGFASGNAVGIPIVGTVSVGGTDYTEYASYDTGSHIPSLSATYTVPASDNPRPAFSIPMAIICM